MSRKKHPTKEFIEDLEKVFKKHNWSGEMIGLDLSAAAAANPCPPNKTPTVVYYKLPDGTTVSKVICK
jgi:hypothetical protein